MRTRFLLIVAVLLAGAGLIVPLQSFKEPPSGAVSIGEFIYTVPLRKEVKPSYVQTQWYHEFLEPSDNDSLMRPILERILNRDLDVYKPEFPYNEKMNPDSAIAKIRYMSQYIYFDEYILEEVLDTIWFNKEPASLVAITFHEEWFYDGATMTLKKKVKGIMPVLDYGYEYDPAQARMIAPFYIPFNSGEIVQADFSARELTFDFNTDSVTLDRGNIFRGVKSGGGFPANQNFRYDKLLASVKSGCKAKKVMLGEPQYPYRTPMDKRKKEATLARIDSATVMRFHEDWKADLRNMRFEKHVQGVLLGTWKNVTTEYVTYDNFKVSETENIKCFSTYVPMGRRLLSDARDAVAVDVPYFTYSVNYQYNPGFVFPICRSSDSLKLVSTVTHIAESARSGKLKVYRGSGRFFSYDPWKPGVPAVNPVEMREFFYLVDSVVVETETGDYVTRILETERSRDDICGLRFFESWKFDVAHSRFEKQIKAVGVLRFLSDYLMEAVRGVECLFAYDNPVSIRDSIVKSEYLIGKNIMSPVLINGNEFIITEGDNGQIIFNYSFHYEENLEASQRYLLVQQVLDQVLAGKVTAYQPTAPEKKISVPEFNTMLDTLPRYYGLNLRKGFEYSLFNELYFDEDWYYNPNTGQMYKHVNAITFAHRRYEIWDPEFPNHIWDKQYFTIRMNQ